MSKRIISIILITIFITGCSAKYNLKIDDSVIEEELLLYNANITELKKNNIPTNYEYDDIDTFNKKIKDIDYYKIDYNDNNTSINHTFNYKDFKKSTILNKCYDSVDTYTDGKSFIISTVGDFKCFDYFEDLDEVNINIYSQYRLINSNADNKNGFNYQWNINTNNISNGIYLELDLSKRNNTLLEMIYTSKLYYTIIIIGLTLACAIVYLIFKKISDAKDKI